MIGMLNPCPFCGGDQDGFAGMTEDAFGRSNNGKFSVCCECGATGPYGDTMGKAVELWDNRIGETSAKEERAKIVAWLMREQEEYPFTEYSGFAAMMREEIEAKEHLK